MKITPLVYSHISYNKIQPRLNPSFGCSSCESNPYTDKAFDIAKKLLIQMQEEVISVKEMGKIAFSMLLEKISGKKCKNSILKHELIIRKSTSKGE